MNTFLRQHLEKEYLFACNTGGDIFQHLPVLKNYADRCDSVTEFGVRWGISSRAFLFSDAQRIRMYDLTLDPTVVGLVEFCQSHGRDVIYHQADTLALEIDHTDMLFVDTLHTYQQLLAELDRHSIKAAKYMAFHDTFTFGTKDEGDWGGPGLLTALVEWLAANPSWQVDYHTYTNNGLTVLRRR